MLSTINPVGLFFCFRIWLCCWPWHPVQQKTKIAVVSCEITTAVKKSFAKEHLSCKIDIKLAITCVSERVRKNKQNLVLKPQRFVRMAQPKYLCMKDKDLSGKCQDRFELWSIHEEDEIQKRTGSIFNYLDFWKKELKADSTLKCKTMFIVYQISETS